MLDALLDETVTEGDDHRMGTIRRAELRDKCLNGFLDGVFGEHHGARELFVGVALCHVAEELELARVFRACAQFRESIGATAAAIEMRRQADEIFAKLRGAAETF